MELILTLPWPPSVNHYKKVGGIVRTKSGKIFQKRVNSPETVMFYYYVYQEAKIQVPLEWLKFADSKEITYEIDIALYPPDKRRRDADNALKVLLDSLVHAKVIQDDGQIVRLLVEKLDTIKHGQVIVKIRESICI